MVNSFETTKSLTKYFSSAKMPLQWATTTTTSGTVLNIAPDLGFCKRSYKLICASHISHPTTYNCIRYIISSWALGQLYDCPSANEATLTNMVQQIKRIQRYRIIISNQNAHYTCLHIVLHILRFSLYRLWYNTHGTDAYNEDTSYNLTSDTIHTRQHML